MSKKQTKSMEGWNKNLETNPTRHELHKVILNDEAGTEVETWFTGTHWHDYDYSEIGWWKEITLTNTNN